MVVRPVTAPFWPTPPRPGSSADPAALAILARLFATAPQPPSAAATPPSAPAGTGMEVPVRAGGRIVGVVLPFPADGEGPVYVPARGPSRIRELLDEGIIG